MMTTPRLVQLAITEAAAAMHQHPEYQLNCGQYCQLLQSFGPSIDLSGERSFFKTGHVPFSPGFRAYGQLAILTAEHVLPIWEQAINQIYLREADYPYDVKLPHSMLAQAQAVLDKRIDPEIVAVQLCSDLYYDMAGLVSFVTYPVFFAAQAAYDAIAIVLGCSSQWGEMTSAACKAASVIDHNEAGVWYTSTKPSSDPSTALYRRREAERAFWEWWLWEAIPSIWTANE